MKSLLSLLTLLLCSLTACAQNPTANHNHGTPEPDPMVEQDWAKQRLAKSPRHQEWIKVKNGAREVNSFVVYPESKNKATAVVVIHEIFGMSDWVQSLTDQLAEAGYVAIAPDLLSGMGPNGGGTSSMDRNAIGQAIRDLPADQITADLNAVVDYVSKLPASNGKVVVTGFCWGGGESFRFATTNPNLRGVLDNADRTWVTGWAVDEGHAGSRVEVQLFVDDAFAAAGTADQYRPDVHEAKRADDDWHGFALRMPTLHPGDHVARVYAVHPNGNGARRTLQLIGKPFNFRVEP